MDIRLYGVKTTHRYNDRQRRYFFSPPRKTSSESLQIRSGPVGAA